MPLGARAPCACELPAMKRLDRPTENVTRAAQSGCNRCATAPRPRGPARTRRAHSAGGKDLPLSPFPTLRRSVMLVYRRGPWVSMSAITYAVDSWRCTSPPLKHTPARRAPGEGIRLHGAVRQTHQNCFLVRRPRDDTTVSVAFLAAHATPLHL